MNGADLEKPVGVEVRAVSSNERFPLGQFIIALWLQSCTTQRQAGIFASKYFANDDHSQRNICFFHVCSPYFLLKHFGLDDKMTSHTALSWFGQHLV